MIDAPSLVEGGKNITLNNLIAHVAQVSKELVVVSLTVSEPFSFVVTISQEGFLTFCTNKMLHTPMLPECRHNSFFYRSPAGSTDRDPHLVMAAQAVQLVQLVGRVSWPGPDLPGAGGQLLATACAVEVVRMVDLATESEWLPINN